MTNRRFETRRVRRAQGGWMSRPCRVKAGPIALWLALTVAAAVVDAAPTDVDWRWEGRDGAATSQPVPASVEGMVMQSDGSVIVALSGSSGPYELPQVIRLDRAGRLDRAFGVDGRVLLTLPGYDSVPSHAPKSLALHSDGRFDVLWVSIRPLTPSVTDCNRILARYLPTGQPDRSFGDDGLLGVNTTQSAVCCWGLELDNAGNSYRVEYTSYPMVGVSSSSISVRARDGTPLPEIVPFNAEQWTYGDLKLDAKDRLVLGLHPRAPMTTGFSVGRTGAGVFGTDGIARVPVAGVKSAPGVLPLARGGVVAFGVTLGTNSFKQAVLVRFTESGDADRAFGDGGVVPLALAEEGGGFAAGVQSLLVSELPDGRLLVAAGISGTLGGVPDRLYLALARLLPDGNPDATFAEGGIVRLNVGWQTRLQGKLIPRTTGEFLLGAQAFDPGASPPIVEAVVFQFLGGELSLPYPWPERQVVEYFHADYEHYFITADENEIAILDRPPGSGWARTGRTFSAYVTGPVPLVPVCRFWSDQSFAPKSSHFYTPYANECAKVKRDPTWRFERDAFHVRMPGGALGVRTCPAGTQPLYRAYNGGMSGAPNHRYMTDPALLDAMVAQGWIMEGEAATRVFACVPAQE
jgi:uncharacterized delta-60 repeat protein